MFQTRQKFLNTFYEKCNGKGRAFDGDLCVYIAKGHPGCAIGCQPGFPAQLNIHGSVDALRRKHPIIFRKWLGKHLERDIKFLEDLQALHDVKSGWKRNEKELKKTTVAAFAKRWKLESPHRAKVATAG